MHACAKRLDPNFIPSKYVYLLYDIPYCGHPIICCKVNCSLLTPHIGVAVHDDRGYENQLCIDDLQNVFSLLIKATNDWYELGLALGIQVDALEGIDSNRNSDKARLREMLTHWLRSSPSRTWSDICNGLRSDTVKQINLADKIEEKYKGT